MSDELQNGGTAPDKDPAPGKHELARRLVEAALAARREGDTAGADDLMAQAEHTDPEAVAEALAERGGDAGGEAPINPADSDLEVAALSRTIEPGSAAPSRANITGPGSGADNL